MLSRICRGWSLVGLFPAKDRCVTPSASLPRSVAPTWGGWLLGLAALGFGWVEDAVAQNGFFRNPAVGGVLINAEGVLEQPTIEAARTLRAEMRERVLTAPDAFDGPIGLRKISLRRLEEALGKAGDTDTTKLPDELRYLGGLQRVEYVLVYPEERDIVLAGPGEAWRVHEQGCVVGVSTGRPVLQIDDLLVALRSVETARNEGISCSIEPTQEGRRRLTEILSRIKTYNAGVPDAVEKALGPQTILLTGIPDTSRFARIMVAADYRMKRYAMHLEQAPVAGLPSFISLMQRTAVDLMPRWWLACNYEAIGRSEDGLAWQLRGPGVKALTELDLIAADGQAQPTGESDPAAQRWAELMTEKYAELAATDLVFGELRNVMDLCVIAAIIRKEGLLEKAELSLPLLVGSESRLALDRWPAPRSVATQASAVKKSRGWVVTASGGVQIDGWQVAERQEVVQQAHAIRVQSAAPPGASAWWWN